MSGPIRGSIEHYFAGSGQSTGSAQSVFISCFNFLNDNTGTLGIQRLAYNTGSQNTGMGQFRDMNYYDQTNPAGDNAFACFRFSSASNPYEILIQYTGNANSLGTAPGAPALLVGSAPTSVFAIAFGQCLVSSSWNGTTLNNGNDRKGTPVWVSGSDVAYYPRSNDHRRTGGHAAQKQNMMGVNSFTNVDYRLHMVADYDNFVMLLDQSADTTYMMWAMLKYVPVVDLTASLPYCSFYTQTVPMAVTTVYGAVAGTSTDQGGISFPDLITSGTVSLGSDRIGTTFFQAAAAQPNRMFGTQRFDEYPLYLGGLESPNQVGLAGQHFDFVREVYNIATHDTNLSGTRAVFGGSLTLATTRYTIPWHSGTTPGTGVSRNGIQFGM